ncbi:hypothetical protein BC936DRAFT_149602 [Jimgerdemannia flammicorona]|uniref:Reverse transcriptase domain-containing protein n=1 Tax=Jimgerdemannia flammicorona TaxID=994334 RepID=A0A433D0I2_9FUNG|nr:hypothetical protein BC936DRAFT_149602 [Jimgerdemannia flammicorona]
MTSIDISKAINKIGMKNNPVYITKVDVANCFDTINTYKLKEIIKKIPQWKEWDDYNITGYSTISSSLGQPTISHKSRAHEYFPQFPKFAECLSQTSKTLFSVIGYYYADMKQKKLSFVDDNENGISLGVD